MDVVGENEGVGWTSVDVVVEDPLRLSIRLGCSVAPVVRVKVHADGVVSKVAETGLALPIALKVRRSKVGGHNSENVPESHLVPEDLVVEVGIGQAVHRRVSPCVGRNLMTTVVDSADYIRVVGSAIVHAARLAIVASYLVVSGSLSLLLFCTTHP